MATAGDEQKLTIEEKIAVLLEKQAMLKDKQAKLSGNNLRLVNAAYDRVNASISAYQKLITVQEKGRSIQQMISEHTRTYADSIKDIVSQIPLIGNLASKLIPTDEIVAKVEQRFGNILEQLISSNEEMVDMGKSGYQSFLSMVRGAGMLRTALITTGVGALVVGLGLVVAAFAKAAQHAFQFNEQAVELTKQWNVSYNTAVRMNAQLRQMAHQYNALLLNSKDFIQGNKELSKALDIRAILTKDILADNALITENLGYQQDEASSIFKLSLINNQSSLRYLHSLELQTEEFKIQNKTLVNTRSIINGILNTSAKTQLIYKNNTKDLVEAAGWATMLGIQLDKVPDMLQRHLNLEESITAEMRARTIFGDKINFNLLRSAAFNRDYITAEKEIYRLISDNLSIMQENPLYSGAFAEALNLSEDELANMIKRTEELNAITGRLGENVMNISLERAQELKTLGKLSDAEFRLRWAQEQRITFAQKWQRLVEKIQEVLFEGRLSDTILQWFDKVDKFLSNPENIERVAHTFEGIAESLADMAQWAEKFFKNTSGRPLWWNLLKSGSPILRGVDQMIYGKGTKVQDAIITKHGDVIHTAPDDNIIATKANVTAPSTGNGNLQQLLIEQNALLKQLLQTMSKPSQIVIGTKVIEAIGSELNMNKQFVTPFGKGYGTK